ncbi:hypothetical protein [Klebsiella pneumoniae]|uniref:hypothetical protein n=1 Tax=Klebsiella pneumoniae TaxID=573 RepID=UPI002ED261AF|nr:hypothetical protein [Klebsiella pneumoniae]
MSNVIKLQFAPRTAAVETDMPDVLVTGLAKLRACKDAIDVLRLTDALPDVLLPHLAWAASRRQDVPARHVQVLVKCCGEPMLERALGRAHLRQLKLRFPVSDPFEPL